MRITDDKTKMSRIKSNHTVHSADSSLELFTKAQMTINKSLV